MKCGDSTVLEYMKAIGVGLNFRQTNLGCLNERVKLLNFQHSLNMINIPFQVRKMYLAYVLTLDKIALVREHGGLRVNFEFLLNAVNLPYSGARMRFS